MSTNDMQEKPVNGNEKVFLYGNFQKRGKRKWYNRFYFDYQFSWKAFGFSISENENWHNSLIIILPFSVVTFYYND